MRPKSWTILPRRSLALVSALLGLALAPNATLAEKPSFKHLGDLPGGKFRSAASAVSADGKIVVGRSETEQGDEAFYWTQDGGMRRLADVLAERDPKIKLDGWTLREVVALSPDGSVIIGSAQSEKDHTEAFRWSKTGGVQVLGVLPGRDISKASGASIDGKIIVGFSGGKQVRSLEAFRWSEADGMRGLGFLTKDKTSSALGVSADGTTVIGFSGNPHPFRAFRWTEADGMQMLDPMDERRSMAGGVSGDGKVIVGFFQTASGTQAFRWTDAAGFRELPGPPGSTSCSAGVLSADGSVIVGSNFGPRGDLEIQVWTEAKDPRRLADVLAERGLQDELRGWTLVDATAITPNGRWIAGQGENSDGQQEAFLVDLGTPLP